MFENDLVLSEEGFKGAVDFAVGVWAEMAFFGDHGEEKLIHFRR